ncbi:MAG TPA: MmgE/PrpD family protein [Aliidongia sp.]|nr:MmgE/PrpD family protein [Aliidongia sp.]
MAGELGRRLAHEILEQAPPAAAIPALKLCLLDFLGNAFEAHSLSWSRLAAAMAVAQGGSEASIVGAGRSGMQMAAFANAVAGHGLVREDMHAGAVSHLGVVVLPALLALSQRRKTSGAAFITAGIIGYELGARLGRALVNPDFSRRWRPTGFTGPLAAAAAAARLLHLSHHATASALSLAANTVSGLNEWPRDGGEEMFFHPGFAARNALTATELAAHGAYGSAGALDGPAGLFAAAGTAVPADLALFADGRAEILSVFHKALPLCNFAQTPTQAALWLAPVPIEAIDHVTVFASEAAVRYPGCDHQGPFERVLQAKMSIQFCVAAALLDGTVTEGSFAILDRPALLQLAAVTSLSARADFTGAFPARQGAEIVVALRDGSERRAAMADLEAATPAAVRARFAAGAAATVGAPRAEAIAKAIDALEAAEDVGALMRLTEARTDEEGNA